MSAWINGRIERTERPNRVPQSALPPKPATPTLLGQTNAVCTGTTDCSTSSLKLICTTLKTS